MALSRGFDRDLTKPLQLDTLLALLDESGSVAAVCAAVRARRLSGRAAVPIPASAPHRVVKAGICFSRAD
jgi:hypothetical protein